MTAHTAVYRLYDAAGSLLYVGITRNPDIRWGHHAATKAWWPDVAERRVVWHADRDSARAEEISAIRAAKPIHNIADTQPRPARRGRQMVLRAADPADRHRGTGRLIRVEEPLWHRFGVLVGIRNRRRVIVEFIRWFVDEPDAELPKRPQDRAGEGPSTGGE